jgi:NAD(P)H-dependent flavin oxidoreductase YrpB (nitropropane dioxygenase family)
MDTRFCATKEAPMHDSIKQALVNATERDTRLIFRTLNNTARVLKNAISDEVVTKEYREGGVEFSEIRPLVTGARGQAALNSGEVDDGIITAGQIIGLIDDIPTCAELIERIVADCDERLSIASSWMK